MKLTPRAYEVLYDAWNTKQVGEGTKLKIKVSKKQNKTYFDEIALVDNEEEEEEEEEQETKKPTQTKPKLKG